MAAVEQKTPGNGHVPEQEREEEVEEEGVFTTSSSSSSSSSSSRGSGSFKTPGHRRLSRTPQSTPLLERAHRITAKEDTDAAERHRALCYLITECGNPSEDVREEARRDLGDCLRDDTYDVNDCPEGERAPLYEAVRLNQPKAVKLLLDHGANPGVRFAGKTPLEESFESGFVEISTIIADHIRMVYEEHAEELGEHPRRKQQRKR